MALDRGTLARIDRRVFTELDHSDGVQVVKVPVSDAVWSTWRRYCEALDLTMGEAVAALISHELATVVRDAPESPVFDRRPASREGTEQRDERERGLTARAAQLRRNDELLRGREARLLRKASEAGARVVTRVGRNEPCPCGSGLKYKRCHGR